MAFFDFTNALNQFIFLVQFAIAIGGAIGGYKLADNVFKAQSNEVKIITSSILMMVSYGLSSLIATVGFIGLLIVGIGYFFGIGIINKLFGTSTKSVYRG